MATSLNSVLLAEMIKNKRNSTNLGLRETAEQIGSISASTLLRVENGNPPDLDTYFKICHWLNVPTDYFSENTEMKENTQKEAIALLRADKKLPKETANMLIEMINLAYGYLEGRQTQKQAKKNQSV